jgi:hypothetical protein
MNLHGENTVMLRTRPVGINPTHTPLNTTPPPSKAEETRRFVESANRLGTHVQWWEVPGGVKLKLFDFAQGDAHVRVDHGPALDDAAAYLAVSPWRRVWIIGNADKVESKNEKTLDWLSLKRAQRVWDQLAKRKVPKSQIIGMNGHGVMGAGAAISQAAPKRDEPGKFRMVEVLLMNMTVQRELEEQKARLKAQGFNV